MFAYGASADAFTNVREAAKQPWMGLTALLGNEPHLVVGKEGDKFVLESQDGTTQRLEQFEWAAATDNSRLVAASRVEGSPFEPGAVLGNYVSGLLAFIDGEWYVRHASTEVLLPLDEMIEVCDELKYSKTALAKVLQKTAFDDELFWLVTNDGQVLLQPEGMLVRNHLELAAQMAGNDYVKQAVVHHTPLGHGGVIRDGKIFYSGLMGTDGNPPKSDDPFGSIAGAGRVRDAVTAVYKRAIESGLEVEPSYGLNAVRPGQGLIPTQRPILTKKAVSWSPAMNNPRGPGLSLGLGLGTEPRAAQQPCPTCAMPLREATNDAAGVAYFCDSCGWSGTDPSRAWDSPGGQRVDDAPHGGMPFGSPSSPFRNTHKLAARFSYEMPPNGLHSRTATALAALGIQANVTLPPNEQFPEGMSVPLPGNSIDLMFYNMGNPDWSGIVAEVDTGDGDPIITQVVMDAMAGKENPNWETVPQIVRDSVDAAAGKRMATDAKDTDADPIVCPKCGSHTIRAFSVGEEAHLKCLTCGNEFYRPAMANPESSVKAGWVLAKPEPMNSMDILRSEVIQGLGYKRIGLMENDQINDAIMAALRERHQTAVPNREVQPELYDDVKARAMEIIGAPHELNADDPDVLNMWPDTLPPGMEEYYKGAAGLFDGIDVPEFQGGPEDPVKTPTGYASGEKVNTPSGPGVVLGPSSAGHVLVRLDANPAAPVAMAESDVQPVNAGAGWPDQLPQGWDGYYNSKVAADDIGFPPCQSCGAMEGFSPYGFAAGFLQCNRCHGLEAVKSVADRYNAMKADAWPDTIPWGEQEQDYYRHAAESKTARLSDIDGRVGCPNCGSDDVMGEYTCTRCSHTTRSGEGRYGAEGGKLNPGTRIQIDHQAHKGQRGTIVEYKGKHKDFDEEQYKVLLDSGEELEEVNESFFHKIKSANVVDNSRLPDSTQNYSLDTMRVAFDPLAPGGNPFPSPYQQDEMALQGADPYNNYPAPEEDDDYEIASCPACDGPGGMLGQLGNKLWFRCRNCNLDFAEKQDVVEPLGEAAPVDQLQPATSPMADMPMDGRPVPPPSPRSPLADPFAHTANWKDANGQPLTAGAWYRMHNPEYKVPDVVRILNLEESRVEAAIESDVKGAFPIIIKGDEGYSFELMDAEPEATIETESSWKISRRNYSPAEQRALIDENPDARARNFDKLDLEGTHYEVKRSYEDPDFLWGE